MKNLKSLLTLALFGIVLSSCSGKINAGYMFEAAWDNPSPQDIPVE